MRYYLLKIAVFLVFICGQIAFCQSVSHYYVSPDGSDNNAGTIDKPFKTIQFAKKTVRNRIVAGLDGDIIVYLRGGSYYLPDGITFGPEDGGSEQCSITYKAYQDEVPVLIGGVLLNNFKEYKGDIYVTDVPESYETNQVFENRTRMTAARSPNDDYYLTLKPVKGAEKSDFYYDPNDFDPAGWDYSQGTIFIWQGDHWQSHWFSREKPINEIDTAQHIIRMGSDVGYPMRRDRCLFYFKNIMAHLDMPGEVFIDNNQKKVYLWPKDGPVEKQAFVAATAQNVLNIQGTKEKKVSNLHFEGLDLSVAKEHAVAISDAQDCSLRFCKVENAGLDGVHVSKYAQRNRIYGCLIQNNGLYGIELCGDGPSKEAVYENHDNIISNNHIQHCGRLIGHGAGIMIVQSGHNTITHNHIHHMPRYGIAINGLHFHELKKRIEGVTLQTQYDYLFARNNYVAFNDVHHVNLETQDTGALESWGPGRDNVYHNNLIHDCGNPKFNIQSGIYLDDASNYFTVTNNIIYNIQGAEEPHYLNQCIYTKGVHNTIKNNILIVSKYCNSAIASFEMANLDVNDHRYINNIIYFEPPVYSKPRFFYGFQNFSDYRVSVSDYNVFYSPAGPLQTNCHGKENLLTFEEWKQLYHNRYELHSVVADPLFVDAENHDYRLRPESPALKLGFEPIDVDAIGLKEDFPKRIEKQETDLFKMKRSESAHRKHRLIYDNDGADIAFLTEPTREAFLAKRMAPLVGTQVDTIFYCTRSSGFGYFTHNTKIGEIFTCTEGRFKDNKTGCFIEQGTDALKMTVDFCKENKIELFWSMRMNDCHDASDELGLPQLKKDHPEWIMDPSRGRLKTRYGAWSAVDYGTKEIRDLAYQYCQEVCQNYDVDGIHLDFFRHPLFFRDQAEGKQVSQEDRDLMTELICRVRTMTERVGMEKGKPILISVRVPDSVGYCNAIGLDIERWMKEGLIDIMVASGYCRLNPWDVTVGLGHKYDIPVYACLSESRHRDEFAKQIRTSPECYRARAMEAWSAGVDGICLFNIFNIFDNQHDIFTQLGDPKTLAGLDKVYTTGGRVAIYAESYLVGGGKFLNRQLVSPETPLKLTPGKTETVNIVVGENIQENIAAGYKPNIELALRLSTEDAQAPKLTVEINGNMVNNGKTQGEMLKYSVDPDWIKQGQNRFTITLDPKSSEAAKLEDIQLFVSYDNNTCDKAN